MNTHVKYFFFICRSTFKGFRDKLIHIHFLRFSFYKLKQLILIVPTTDNFCFIAHIKKVDTEDNQKL